MSVGGAAVRFRHESGRRLIVSSRAIDVCTRASETVAILDLRSIWCGLSSSELFLWKTNLAMRSHGNVRNKVADLQIRLLVRQFTSHTVGRKIQGTHQVNINLYKYNNNCSRHYFEYYNYCD